MTEDLSRTYRVGVIGYGDYGTFLIKTWKTLPNLEIAAIAGRKEKPARKAAEELGIPKCYAGERSSNEIIADPDLDLIAVVTPPFTHAEMAEQALRAGKHVHCEKPLATTVEDAERVCKAVRETRNRLAMGFVLRYDPLYHRLKRLVEEKVFGELHRIDFQNFAGDESLPPDHWFWDPSKSGGILVEHGVHFFDIYTWLADSAPKRITGHRTLREGTRQEDRVMATVEYENGILASFYHAFDKPARMEKTTARLAFDRGYMEVEGWIGISLQFDAALEPGDRERLDAIFPEWKEREKETYTGDAQKSRGGGNDYTLAERVQGSWTLSEDKQAVYEACARRQMADLLHGIDDPGHEIQADVTAGLESVRIATAVPPPE